MIEKSVGLTRRRKEFALTAILGITIACLVLGYVLIRKFKGTTIKVDFEEPQSDIVSVVLEVREDRINHFYLIRANGSVDEVKNR